MYLFFVCKVKSKDKLSVFEKHQFLLVVYIYIIYTVNINIQPLVYAVDGSLHIVEVFGQTTNSFLQLSDPLRITCRR